VSVSVAEGTAGEKYHYRLTNQGGSGAAVFEAGSKFTKLVHRGSYEIKVSQSDKSAFTLIKVPGLFKTGAASAGLSEEKQRKFVGDNPAPCTFFSGNLYSYECGGYADTLNIHMPAGDEAPTYTLPALDNESLKYSTLEGLVKTNQGELAVVQVPTVDTDPAHLAYKLSAGLKFGDGTPLTGLDGNTVYSIKPYLNGFIAYDNALKTKYYPPNLKPENIPVPQPADTSFKPYLLNSNGSVLTASYSNTSTMQIDLDNPNIKVDTIVAVYDKGRGVGQTYRLTGPYYVDARYCGNNKLCLVGNRTLFVYDLSTKQPKLLYQLNSVQAINEFEGKLLVIRQDEILRLDIDTQRAAIDYNLGEYQYCGVQADSGYYTLCLMSPKHKKVALQIDARALNQDSIDKKIVQLQKLPQVSDVSIYGEYIYVSPNYGSLVYDRAANGYGPDPGAKKRADSKIAQKLSELGIEKAYKVIKTF
jgi:hypothetical protein